MKTLAVLAALAAVTAAVPTLPSYYEENRPAQFKLPALIKREKKSAQFLTSEDMANIEMQQLDTTPEGAARTIGLKKPIIIKKKFGYHLYRDSAEERAAESDPSESCTKKLKFKFCGSEAESAPAQPLAQTSPTLDQPSSVLAQPSLAPAQMRSANTHDMEHGIKLAKEAIENLQRFTKIQKDASSDPELHEDIEKARQALDHLQKIFGNLESMNIQPNTLSEAETLQGPRFKVAKSDEERVVQWKEAIENIQKNAEIARNIEDSFKITSDSHVDQTKMKNSESTTLVNDDVVIGKSSVNNNVQHSQLAALKKQVGSEIEPAASEHIEMKVAMGDETSKNNEASEKVVSFDDFKQGKSSELQVALHEPIPVLKVTPADHEDSASGVALIKQSRALENIGSNLAPVPSAIAEIAVKPEKEKNAVEEHQNVKTLAKSSDSISETNADPKTVNVDTTMLMKSVELGLKPEFHKKNFEEKQLIPKSNEMMPVDQPKTISEMNSAHLDDLESHQTKAGFSRISSELKSASHQEEVSALKTQDHDLQHESQTEKMHMPELKASNSDTLTTTSLPVFKSSDNLNIATEAQLNHKSVLKESNFEDAQNLKAVFKTADLQAPANDFIASNLQGGAVQETTKMEHQFKESDFHFSTQGKNWHEDLKSESLKTADTENRDAAGVPRTHSFVHHEPVMHHMHHHEHHLPIHHPHHMMHHKPMFHGKTIDMDSETSPTTLVGVNVDGKAAAEHGSMMQWKQKEGARGAYGPGPFAGAAAASEALSLGPSSGPDALGVFPGAKVGGCAVPLLLSCAPSVVSGTIAEAPYAAPLAYRSTGKLTGRFHKKRDAKVEISSKVKRTPTKVIQKIPLDKKL